MFKSYTNGKIKQRKKVEKNSDFRNYHPLFMGLINEFKK